MSAEERIIREELHEIEDLLRHSGKLAIVSPWIAANEVRAMIKAGESDKIAEKLFRYGYGSTSVECHDLAALIIERYSRLQAAAGGAKDQKLPL